MTAALPAGWKPEGCVRVLGVEASAAEGGGRGFLRRLCGGGYTPENKAGQKRAALMSWEKAGRLFDCFSSTAHRVEKGDPKLGAIAFLLGL
jgi:hypothetical protein